VLLHIRRSISLSKPVHAFANGSNAQHALILPRFNADHALIVTVPALFFCDL
jgi:hypothetical protein